MSVRRAKLSTCIIGLALSALLLAACSSTSEAPVTDRSAKLARYQSSVTGPPPKYGYAYTVRKGDTLYSIAYAIKQDYQRVAAWNGIRKPYTIYVGQRLRLYPTRSSKKKTATPQPSRSTSASKPTTTSKPATSTARPPAKTASSGGKYLGTVKSWRWPTRSYKVASRFSPSNGREGIDISGRKGDAVYSTANGEIVYAGNGLRGYGRLIIVKHNNTYLSAYAHNEKILVTEGQGVRAGQKIAEMGTGGTGRYKLHFEIRKKGTPVNPLKYLPKR